jgi:hypothetical protein
MSLDQQLVPTVRRVGAYTVNKGSSRLATRRRDPRQVLHIPQRLPHIINPRNHSLLVRRVAKVRLRGNAHVELGRDVGAPAGCGAHAEVLGYRHSGLGAPFDAGLPLHVADDAVGAVVHGPELVGG